MTTEVEHERRSFGSTEPPDRQLQVRMSSLHHLGHAHRNRRGWYTRARVSKCRQLRSRMGPVSCPVQNAAEWACRYDYLSSHCCIAILCRWRGPEWVKCRHGVDALDPSLACLLYPR